MPADAVALSLTIAGLKGRIVAKSSIAANNNYITRDKPTNVVLLGYVASGITISTSKPKARSSSTL